MSLNQKIVIIKRPTRLDTLIARFNTESQAKFYVEHLGADFSDYQAEHTTYYRAFDILHKTAELLGRVQVIDWSFIPNFIFGPEDLVLTLGRDGLVANTLKYLQDQFCIGFNSDPARWDGVLSQHNVEYSAEIIEKTINGEGEYKSITKGKVELSDKQVLYAVNDFFLGVSNHSSARYIIRFGGQEEFQSSSGIIISTPLGGTGWMQSVLTGALGVINSLSDSPLQMEGTMAFPWDIESLTFAVREPFPSISSQTSLVFGQTTAANTLTIESCMGEKGIIFSDGVQNDFLEFNYSVTAKFGIAETKGRLVVRPGEV